MSIDDQKYYTGSAYCNKCGKPFTYVGDIPNGGWAIGQEPFCTCGVIKCVADPNYQITFPTLNTGWVCPVCGRGVRPNLTSCPCHCEPNEMSA